MTKNENLNITYNLGKHKYPFSFQIFEKALEITSKSSDTILDAGCGPNSPLLRLDRFKLAVGLDLKYSNLQKMAKECRDKKIDKISLVLASVSYLPFKDDAFNIVAMRDVLEHVDDIPQTLKQLAISLEAGGKLFLTTTNILNPIMFLDRVLPSAVNRKITGKFGPSCYDRHNHPSPFELIKLISKKLLIPKYMSMFSIPPFITMKKLQIYQQAFPRLYYGWVAFEKLTNTTLTRNFKEIIFLVIEKEHQKM